MGSCTSKQKGLSEHDKLKNSFKRERDDDSWVYGVGGGGSAYRALDTTHLMKGGEEYVVYKRADFFCNWSLRGHM